MKQILSNLIWEAQRDLERMQVSKMSLQDRILYENAKVRLETLKDIMNKCNVSLPQ